MLTLDQFKEARSVLRGVIADTEPVSYTHLTLPTIA